MEEVELADIGIDERIVGSEGWESEGIVKLVKLCFRDALEI